MDWQLFLSTESACSFPTFSLGSSTERELVVATPSCTLTCLALCLELQYPGLAINRNTGTLLGSGTLLTSIPHWSPGF